MKRIIQTIGLAVLLYWSQVDIGNAESVVVTVNSAKSLIVGESNYLKYSQLGFTIYVVSFLFTILSTGKKIDKRGSF